MKKLKKFNYTHPVWTIFMSIFIFLLILLVVKYSQRNNNWWKIQFTGSILSSIAYEKNFIFIGDNSGELKSIDASTGKTVWSKKVQGQINTPVLIKGDRLVFTTSVGVVYAVHKLYGSELWHFEVDNLRNINTSVYIDSQQVIFGDSNGKIYDVNIKNGKANWFVNVNTQLSEDILHNPHYLYVINNRIIYTSGNNTIFIIDKTTGKIIRYYKSKTPIKILDVFSKTIIYSDTQGYINAISLKGESLWESKLSLNEIKYIVQLSSKSFVAITNNGDILVVNINTGRVISTTSSKLTQIIFPIIKDNSIILTSSTGEIEKINLLTGKSIWKYRSKGEIQSPPLLTNRNPFLRNICDSSFFNGWLSKICLKTIIWGNIRGGLYAIRYNSGKLIWENQLFGANVTTPITDGVSVYVPTLDGGVYKFKSINGRTNLKQQKPKIKVEKNGGVYEISIFYDDSEYVTPWKDITLASELTNKNNKVFIYGFYYDKNTWQLRFRPPTIGKWQMKVYFTMPDNTQILNQTIDVNTVELFSYFQVSSKYANRMTIDGKNIFNGYGIGEYIHDANCDGDILNDFFVGDVNTYKDINHTEIRSCQLTNTLDFNEYLNKYSGGDGSIFNIFRFSIDNASFNLWKSLNPGQLEYLIKEGKTADRLVFTLERNHVLLWLTFFSWLVPFEDVWNQSPQYQYNVETYIRYIMARYGAYASIWEITNESHTTDGIIASLSDYVKNIDYLPRLVTTSWEKPYLKGIDAASLHWYEDEDLSESDSKVKDIVHSLGGDKLVFFSEQGNKDKNYSPDSGDRMRVRSWSALFQHAPIIFWNTSFSNNYNPPNYMNGNIYIGENERQFVRVLRNLTNTIDLNYEELSPDPTNGFRIYGLKDQNSMLFYIFSYQSPHSSILTGFSYFIPTAGTAKWIDPKDGKELGEFQVDSGVNYFYTPIFNTDIVLKINFNND